MIEKKNVIFVYFMTFDPILYMVNWLYSETWLYVFLCIGIV